jgi:hypothetical protein
MSVPALPARNMVEGSSDNELVRRVGDADGAALAELHQRFGRRCYALARRVCVDEGWAHDVVQEVFLTLWRDPSRFELSRGGLRDVDAHADPPPDGGRGAKREHPVTAFGGCAGGG